MNKIYLEISKLSDKFREIANRYSNDKNEINDSVQELFIYFLQMNPNTLKNIYEKDGIIGIIKYGTVALRRSLGSPRSSYYYKYKKYYTQVFNYPEATYENKEGEVKNKYYIENLPEETIDVAQWEKLEQIDLVLDNLHWYDRELFKLYYYEGNTLDSLAEKTNISRNSLFSTIDKVRTILKKELSE